MKRLAVVMFACALALGLLAPAVRVQAAYAPDDQEQEIVGLINDYRATFGLQPVSLTTDLGEAAQHHSEDMADNNYFSHTLADGSSPEQNIRNFGYTGSTWGENIAAGMSSAPDALQAWKNSPEHDAILRDPDFSLVGIGRAYNADTQYGWYWTADFGGPEGSAPATTDAAPPTTDASNTTSPATTTTDVNGVKTQTVDGVSKHQQQAPSDGGNSTANAEPSPVVMGDLDLRGTTTTIVVPPSSSTGDASGGNNVNTTPPPPPPADTSGGGAGTGQAGRATASGSDGSITYNASDNGNGNQVITTGDGSGDSGNSGNGGGNGGGNDGNGGNGGGDTTQNSNQPVATCSDFSSWYDAQNAYEAAGGTNADPALVNSLDPDWDGIACEEMMNS